MSAWDPDRASTLYTELLDSPGLTPVLRSQVSAAITLLQGTIPAEEP